MYRTYSVNDMPQPIERRNRGERAQKPRNEEKREELGEELYEEHRCEEKSEIPIVGAEVCDEIHNNELECEALCEPESEHERSNINKLLANIKLDDIIIFAVIVILLMDECDDKLLILALGFILFADFFDF
ncbi:MAG: hypothetical protein LUD03_02375 [Firmicutes bacterium]|nr:hypothetical protein [Bacillota bacterium]